MCSAQQNRLRLQQSTDDLIRTVTRTFAFTAWRDVSGPAHEGSTADTPSSRPVVSAAGSTSGARRRNLNSSSDVEDNVELNQALISNMTRNSSAGSQHVATPWPPQESAWILVPHVRIVHADDATAAAYDTMCRDLHRAHYLDGASYIFAWRDTVAGLPEPMLVLRRNSNWMVQVLFSWPMLALSWLTFTSSLHVKAILRMVPERSYHVVKEIAIVESTPGFPVVDDSEHTHA